MIPFMAGGVPQLKAASAALSSKYEYACRIFRGMHRYVTGSSRHIGRPCQLDGRGATLSSTAPLLAMTSR